MLSFFVKSLLEAGDYDLIHAHWLFSGLVGVWIKRLSGKKFMITSHGSDINELNTKWQKRIASSVLREADKIVTVSNDLKQKIIRLGINENKVRVIPNGVNASELKPINIMTARKKTGLPANKKIILFTGRLLKEKGLAYLVNAMSAVKKRHKDALLVLIGEGPFRQEIRKVVEEKKLEGSVLVLAPKPHDEIKWWFNSADLVVLPSLKEGFGVTLIEAMACGKPIIGTKVGGIKDIIEDKVNGFFVPVKDSKALAQKITRLLENEKLAGKMGASGRKIVMKKFSVEAMVSAYVEEYRKLVK